MCYHQAQCSLRASRVYTPRTIQGASCGIGRELSLATSPRQLLIEHPHERHPRLRKDPAVEPDLDRGCRHGCWAAQDAWLLGAGDEVEGVDAADAAVAVPELDLQALGRSGDVEVEQVPVALDEDPA